MPTFQSDIFPISNLLKNLFASDSNYHARQMPDGRYIKARGKISAYEIRKMLFNELSIAIYQRNRNTTVNWICFDFDIIKSVLGSKLQNEGEAHIVELVNSFCAFLDNKNVKYLLEFSGNRGFHVWLLFETSISYKNAHQILKTILNASNINTNWGLVDIDLFPSTANVSGKYGKGVKIPLSKHQKSQNYSYLLNKKIIDYSSLHKDSLSDEFISEQTSILESHQKNNIAELELIFNIEELEFEPEDTYYKIRKVFTTSKSISADKLINHWKSNKEFKALAELVEKDNCSHEVRKLITGILANLTNDNGANIGKNLILDLFESFENFNRKTTQKHLEHLSDYFFPSFYLISKILKIEILEFLPEEEVLSLLIPNYNGFDEALFDVTKQDIEVTKSSEIKYLRHNDEVIIHKVQADLNSTPTAQLMDEYHTTTNFEDLEYYSHIRNEGEKNRTLVTLSAKDRVYSSLAIKKLSSIYIPFISENSYGYQINENFKDGHIFKRWLYQWVQFLSGINDVISGEENQDYYIVKTDISSFYESIHHDHLERLLLNGPNKYISNKLDLMSEENSKTYKRLVSSLVSLTRKLSNNLSGVPQGPAYARLLAEIYLIDIDDFMDHALGSNSALFYHRYVDDIFFVCENKTKADLLFSQLKDKLALYSLNINKSKTEVTKISNFKNSFDKYRAQSKYIIDYNHKDFESQSDYKKNFIMEKFAELASNNDGDDDSFVFSHLLNIKKADKYRLKKVTDILQKKVARGSLFNKVFKFILKNDELTVQLREAESFDLMQSEVLSSTLVELRENIEIESSDIESILGDILPKMQFSKAVYENLMFLELKFGIHIHNIKINPDIIIGCISSIGLGQKIHIIENTFEAIQSELNNIQSLDILVNVIYKTAIESVTKEKSIIYKSGSIFFAKLANDINNKSISCQSIIKSNNSELISGQIYQLLCLFSSTDIINHKLLESIWKIITQVFNSFSGDSYIRTIEENYWLINLDLLDMSSKNFNQIITSIVTGSITNVPDEKEIFIRYHQTLVAYCYSKINGESKIDIKKAMSEIKHLNDFYEWIQLDDVVMFPSQKWFVENLINNDMIMLQKGNEVLIRKPTHDFINDCSTSLDLSTSRVYGEKKFNYQSSTLTSIEHLISTNSGCFASILEVVSNIMKSCDFSNNLCGPNFFAQNPLIQIDNLNLFCSELSNQEYLIIEDEHGRIDVIPNNLEKFIYNLFKAAEKHRSKEISLHFNILDFYEKYLRTLNPQRMLIVLDNLVLLLKGKNSTNQVLLDCAAVSAYISSYDDKHFLFDNFVNYYIHIHSNDPGRMNILYVDENTSVKNSNIFEFFTSIINSLSCTARLLPDLSVSLHPYLEAISQEVSNLIESRYSRLNLIDFKKVNIAVNLLNETVRIESNLYNYKDVTLLNMATSSFDQLTDENENILKSSDMSFVYENHGQVVLCIFPSWLNNLYDSLEFRVKNLTSHDAQIARLKDLYTSSAVDLTKYLKKDRAIKVVSEHHKISLDKAKAMLEDWLLHIPLGIRDLMIKVIAGHEYISTSDVDKLLKKFIEEFNFKDSQPVIIKNLTDQNGLHRILSLNPNDICRDLNQFSPLRINSNAKKVTFFADISITGSQITKALSYYLDYKSIKEKVVTDNHYFKVEPSEAKYLSEILKKQTEVFFYFSLYTQQSKNKIEEFFNEHFPDIKIVIEGRDITDSCFLEDTVHITAKDKIEIFDFLQNKDRVHSLINGPLKITKKQQGFLMQKVRNLDSIKRINFVTRFKSMPKGALEFLTAEIAFKGIHSSIFNRIKEHNEFANN